MNKLKMTALGARLVSALVGVSAAHAGGSQLFEESVAGLGIAQADAAAGYNDASTE
jgi:long-subunit fatty acid transport protein